MTAQKTQIGAKDQAHGTAFQPNGGISATDVQEAIEEVNSDAAAELAAHLTDADPHEQYATAPEVAGIARRVEIKSRTAQAAADDAAQVSRVALGAARRADLSARFAQFSADDARQMAARATGLAQRADVRIRKIDDVQIALKAQVFN